MHEAWRCTRWALAGLALLTVSEVAWADDPDLDVPIRVRMYAGAAAGGYRDGFTPYGQHPILFNGSPVLGAGLDVGSSLGRLTFEAYTQPTLIYPMSPKLLKVAPWFMVAAGAEFGGRRVNGGIFATVGVLGGGMGLRLRGDIVRKERRAFGIESRLTWFMPGTVELALLGTWVIDTRWGGNRRPKSVFESNATLNSEADAPEGKGAGSVEITVEKTEVEDSEANAVGGDGPAVEEPAAMDETKPEPEADDAPAEEPTVDTGDAAKGATGMPQ